MKRDTLLIVRITSEMRDRLKLAAEKCGTKPSAFVRMAVSHEIAQQLDPQNEPEEDWDGNGN